MNDRQTQPHYAPSSVGALMDPAFLRSVMIEANGEHRPEALSPSPLLLRWQGAWHNIAFALSRQ